MQGGALQERAAIENAVTVIPPPSSQDSLDRAARVYSVAGRTGRIEVGKEDQKEEEPEEEDCEQSSRPQ